MRARSDNIVSRRGNNRPQREFLPISNGSASSLSPSQITLLAGIYGLVGPIANMVCLAYIDKWGRKPTMWITGIVMSCNMAILMALTSQYTGTTNTTGQGATIAFIFTFSIVCVPSCFPCAKVVLKG